MVSQPLYDNYLEILFSGREEILMAQFIPMYGFKYITSRTFFSGSITEKGNFYHTAGENEISDCHIIAFHVLSGTFKSFETEVLAGKLGNDFAPCLAQLSSPESRASKNQLEKEIYQLSQAMAGKWQLVKKEIPSGNHDYLFSDTESRCYFKSECNQSFSPEKFYAGNKTRSWSGRNVSRLLLAARRMFNKINQPGNSSKNLNHEEKFSEHLITDFPYTNEVILPVRVNHKPKIQREGKLRIFSHLTYFFRKSNHIYKMKEIKKQISSG